MDSSTASIKNTRQLHTAGVRCRYNAALVEGDTVQSLLADGAALLFRDSKQICQTANATSFEVTAGDQRWFAKEYKRRKWYRRLSDVALPACYASYRAGFRLLQAGLPTPAPILAAVVRTPKGKRQILVTELCPDAVGLDQAMREAGHGRRLQLLDHVFPLLAQLHGNGFYSHHLRAANILVTAGKQKGRPQLTFIDLDRLGSNIFFPHYAYVSGVSRAAFEFWDDLTPEERQYLLRAAFDAALKSNIYARPSDQQAFMAKAAAMIKRRK